MFKTIAHQALEFRKNNEEVERDGPYPVKDITNAYLGAGYYFWDNHIDLAHWWGYNHCKKKYIICESELEVESKDFLDLIGSREDMINYQSLIDKLKIHDMVMGKQIEFLKELNSKSKGIFPYKVIRAQDSSKKKSFPQNEYKFSEHLMRPGFTILSPMYIICLIEKNKVILPSYKVVFSQ